MAPMLELRPDCELCDRDLPPDSTEAMICIFECTFGTSCVRGTLANVCPSCGGRFTSHPIRPGALLDTRPASRARVRHPLDPATHAALLARYRGVPPGPQ